MDQETQELQKLKALSLVKNIEISYEEALQIVLNENLSYEELLKEFPKEKTKKNKKTKKQKIQEFKEQKNRDFKEQKNRDFKEQKNRDFKEQKNRDFKEPDGPLIKNPENGRLVKKDGKKGKEILKQMRLKFYSSLKDSDESSEELNDDELNEESSEELNEDSENILVESQFKKEKPILKLKQPQFQVLDYKNSSNSKEAPSSRYVGSDEWSQLSRLEPDIMKLTLQILTEESIKYESGSSNPPMISFCISMATDRIKIINKEKEILEKEIMKKEEIEEIDDYSNETPSERNLRIRNARMAFLDKLNK